MLAVLAASITEKNKQLATQWLEMVSAGDVEGICRITDKNWVMHGGLHGMPPGPDGVRRMFASFGATEQQWTIQMLIGEADKVVIRATGGCWQKSFMGVPAHGRPQLFTTTFIHHIAGGKIMETWRNGDDLGRLLQLGAQIVAAPVAATFAVHRK